MRENNIIRVKKLLVGGTSPYSNPYSAGNIASIPRPSSPNLSSLAGKPNINVPQLQPLGGIGAGGWQAIGLGADMLGGLIRKADAYDGQYGSMKQMGDQTFDQASNAVMMVNPLVGGIMKAGGLVSDVLTNYAGMGTDNMTKTDAILGSKLLSLTPFGMINGWGGKKTLLFSADQDTIAQVGGSYGGSVAGINDAASKANKKYGLFSSGARRRANRLIDKMRGLLNTMADIAKDASDMSLIATSMSDINHLAYGFDMSGGYDLRYMRAAKLGGVINRIRKINFHKLGDAINGVINLETKLIDWEPIIEDIPEFKDGGILDWEPEITDLPILEFQKGGKTRTIEELIEYAKLLNPRFIQRLSEEPKGIKFKDDEGNDSEGSHYLESRGEYVIPRILEVDGELKFFNPQEAIDRALEKGNFLKMSIDEAKLFAEHYKQGWPEFFKKFKSGGKTDDLQAPEIEETTLKNVIPEGALHAHKHHMENDDNITKKGIPVIDNDGELLAEIELNEIIFTLEVTKKLEELMEDGSDEAAIQAGKLLVEQILFNTDDRTGLIKSCKKGGKL